MKSLDLESRFLDYAARVDGIRPRKDEWEETKVYLMPQINALVGRYSKLDQEAFYRFYLPIDDILLKAMDSPSTVF